MYFTFRILGLTLLRACAKGNAACGRPLAGEQILVQRTDMVGQPILACLKGHTETVMPLREGADIDAGQSGCNSLPWHV
jgi:hypothetical protein